MGEAAQYAAFARESWETIRQSLLDATYQPSPVKCVEIPKASGGTQPLGIPTVQDRLIRQAVYQAMMPIFNPGFSEFSFGFRPGKSAHGAVYKARAYIREGYRLTVDMDLSKFFDKVHYDVLMYRAAAKIPDKRVLHLIGKSRGGGQGVLAENP